MGGKRSGAGTRTPAMHPDGTAESTLLCCTCGSTFGAGTRDLGHASANILFSKWRDISMFGRPGRGLQMFCCSLAPRTFSRCAGVQLRLLFNKRRNSLVFTARDRNGRDTVGLTPFLRLPARHRAELRGKRASSQDLSGGA